MNLMHSYLHEFHSLKNGQLKILLQNTFIRHMHCPRSMSNSPPHHPYYEAWIIDQDIEHLAQ